jgi:hypothetical protein
MCWRKIEMASLYVRIQFGQILIERTLRQGLVEALWSGASSLFRACSVVHIVASLGMGTPAYGVVESKPPFC